MRTIKDYLNEQLEKSYYAALDHKVPNKFLYVVFNGTIHDYANRSLIGLSKTLEKEGIKRTPEELFDILTINLNFDNFDVIFENNVLYIDLKQEFVISMIKQKQFLNLQIPNKKQILVDYSSPNIAKDMHVGHLRSTIIGDSICTLFELQGHKVHRINHIGDFGTQFGMIIQHLLEMYPDYENSNLSIADLQTFYAQSKKRFDSDEDFKIKAYNKVVLLQQGNEEIVKAWNFIKDISRKSYEEIYKRLDINNLVECGESFYQPFIPELILELESAGILVEEEGRKIIKLDNYEVPLTIVKSDGGYTYDTTDLAAVKYRLQTLKMDKIIYVTDVGQGIHFDMIFKVAEQMKWLNNNKEISSNNNKEISSNNNKEISSNNNKEKQELVHVGFGLVKGPDNKKLKSRSGDTIKLMELLDEAVEKASIILEDQQELRSDGRKRNFTEEEKTNIINSIGYGSIKYSDLSSTRTNDYKFSFDKMLSMKGNSYPYNAYAYVRICSILKNAEEYLENMNLDDFTISEKEEIHVCKLLIIFPEIIDSIAENLMFHNLCSYLYDLTNAFSVFHRTCRCLEYNEKKELIGVNQSRRMLCLFAKTVLEKCFNILGIIPIEKM